MAKEYAHRKFFFETASAKYSAYCHAENTRNGFKHVCTLFYGEPWETVTATCHYLNRTWERYDYQSALFSAVRSLIERRENRLKDLFMSARGYERMTQKRRAEFEAVTDQDEEMQELRNLYNEIEEYGKPLF